MAGWAAVRRALGSSWARAGAVFTLVKVVDSASFLLVGLAGGLLLARGRGSAFGPLGLAAGVAAVFGLAFLPWAGDAVLGALEPRLRPGGRLRRAAGEARSGLAEARRAPGRWGIAAGFSALFVAFHLVTMRLVFDAVGVPASVAGLAFGSLTSVLASAVVPSPAGTFGPMESGFAAGLAASGIPVGPGAAAAAAAHALTTAVSGLVALPFFLRRAEEPRPGGDDGLSGGA